MLRWLSAVNFKQRSSRVCVTRSDFMRVGAKKNGGFTLIELLIVIAIILILIAIALPNFLEAQIRAKVTRVRGEFRTIEEAITAYRTQNPRFPFTEPHPQNKPPLIRRPIYRDLSGARIRFAHELTTPVKFLQTVNFIDPFIGNWATSPQHGDREYSYYFLNYETFALWRPSPANTFEGWALCSWALDRADSGCSWLPQVVVNAKKQGQRFDYAMVGVIYSPTNGTNSPGDIAKYGGFVPAEVKVYDK